MIYKKKCGIEEMKKYKDNLKGKRKRNRE